MESEKEFKHKIIGRTKKKNSWMYASIAIGVLLLLSLMQGGLSIGNSSLDSQEAGEQTVEYINTNLLQGGATATLESVSEEGSLYKINVKIEGQPFESFMTKDGKFLFPQGINLDEQSDTVPTQNQPSASPTPNTGSKVDVSVDDDPSIGPENAPITIVEFSDFECPFCARALPAIRQVLEEYEGQVKLVYRDFPLSFHANAQKAAEAAECADDQGKFWDYHDKIFENQQSIGVNSLKQYAKDLGLDSSEFDTCLDSGKHTDEVRKDFADGQKYGVSGTPAFFINGIRLTGAQPFSAFKQVIDGELAK